MSSLPPTFLFYFVLLLSALLFHFVLLLSALLYYFALLLSALLFYFALLLSTPVYYYLVFYLYFCLPPLINLYYAFPDLGTSPFQEGLIVVMDGMGETYKAMLEDLGGVEVS